MIQEVHNKQDSGVVILYIHDNVTHLRHLLFFKA